MTNDDSATRCESCEWRGRFCELSLDEFCPICRCDDITIKYDMILPDSFESGYDSYSNDMKQYVNPDTDVFEFAPDLDPSGFIEGYKKLYEKVVDARLTREHNTTLTSHKPSEGVISDKDLFEAIGDNLESDEEHDKCYADTILAVDEIINNMKGSD